MCGIVGLLLKNEKLRPQLGQMISPMLVCMGDRGPDSAGLAVFSMSLAPAQRRYSLYSDEQFAWSAFWESFCRDFGQDGGNSVTNGDAKMNSRENHALVTTVVEPVRVKEWLAATWPRLHLLSAGRSIDVYKDAG